MRSSRALAGLAGLATVGVLILGTTGVTAAPASRPSGDTPHSASGPGVSGDNTKRRISWSGITWVIFPNGAKGPENVALTNASDAVYVDHQGRLHLNIVKIHGVWRSVEMQSLDRVSYGTYRLINDTATARFSDRTVFGMFVYQPHTKKYTNEIDIENSRFPHYLPAPDNAQFAVQPYKLPGHEHHYHVKQSYRPLYQEFTWYPPVRGKGAVSFQTRIGASSRAPLLSRWTYFGNSDPTTNLLRPMYLYLDLWLNSGLPPTGGTHSAILRSLTITPLS